MQFILPWQICCIATKLNALKCHQYKKVFVYGSGVTCVNDFLPDNYPGVSQYDSLVYW